MNDQYQALYQTFRWLVPTQFNIAEACCHRWASSTPDARRIAIYHEDESGNREVWTYARLGEATNQLANGLMKMGVARGDRVAVVLGQRPEAVVAHMAIYSVGAVAMPLSAQSGPDALQSRLCDADAHVAIVDHASSANLLSISDNCPNLHQIIGIGFADERVLPWRSLLARQPGEFKTVQTLSSDPAILLYTSGATGAPRGALLPHSALIGSLPGFVASQDWFPRHGDVFWTPADWAGPEGLTDSLLPTLYFGHPIVATRARFSPVRAYELMERYQITNACLSPAVLRQLRQADPEPRDRYRLALRSIMASGQTLGAGLSAWCESALGVEPNEMYGTAEANYVVGNSRKRWPARPGSMGRPYPGHLVAVLDEDGRPAAPGQVGEIAVGRQDIHGFPDPVLFLGYWGNDTATQARCSGDWCRTGDLASADADGYLWYAGRVEDAFVAGGRRIAPAPIERRLMEHAAVSQAAVVPRPGAAQGTAVKAYVALAAETGLDERESLAETLRAYLAEGLPAHEVPAEIEFLDALPMTANGRVQRRILRQLEEDRALAAAKAGI